MDKRKPDHNNFTRIMRALDLMIAPEGATVTALMERLEIPRHSVLSLLKTMEEKLPLSVTFGHETFEEPAVYRLPRPYIEKLSHIKIDLTLDFYQALFVYMLLCDSGISTPTITEKKVTSFDFPDSPS
jgi:hypothetical protein